MQKIEEIPFYNGDNKLTISLLYTKYRKYKIEINLNDEAEVKPANFVGRSAAFSFWNMLKQALKVN